MKTILTALVIFFMFSIWNNKAPASARILDITYNDLTSEARKQVECLADNIYYEAGTEPEDGKYAVAHVTYNRIQDSRFPHDICGVVKQKTKVESIGDNRIVCQFSWYCERYKVDKSSPNYKEAVRIALHFYANYEFLNDNTNGALFYHADYVNPRWKGLQITGKIGRHIFYKERAIT